MTSQAISRSSAWLMNVDEQTRIQIRDTYWRAGVKVFVGTVAKITLCILSALECLCRIAFFIPSAVIALWNKDTLSHVVQRIGSAGQNTVQSLAAIFQVKATKVKTESAWSGKVRACKNILYQSCLTLSQSCFTYAATTHKSTVHVAKRVIGAMTVAYAVYHFAAIKAKVFSFLGLGTPTLLTLVAQLFNNIYIFNGQQLNHTFKNISLHYPIISIGFNVIMTLLAVKVLYACMLKICKESVANNE